MKIIQRKRYLKKVIPYIDKSVIKVFVGQRRTGKSILMKLVQSEIMERNKAANFILINKEMYEFESIKNSMDLYSYVVPKLKKKSNYLFIDEVQDIDGFETALRDLLTRGTIDIYITGSNAKMLSGELATGLSGRYIEIDIHPLSFSEFLVFHNLDSNASSLNKFLKFGGMPYLRNLVLEEEVVNPYLRSIYDTILLKDIVSRYNLRNVDFLVRLTEYLAENTGNIISAKKISDYLKSQKMNIPANTVINYLGYLANTFIINKVRRAELEGKKIFEINDKYYFDDLGLRNVLIGFRPQDISKILENAVYNHLKYLGYDITIGVMGGKEIDFVCSSPQKKLYAQVCYLLNDESVVKREFGNLLAIPDNYEKIVISMDSLPIGDYKGVTHMNLLEFLEKEK